MYQPPCPICQHWVKQSIDLNNPNVHHEDCPWANLTVPRPDIFLLFWHIKAAYQQHRMKLGEAAAYLGIEPDQAVALFGAKGQIVVSQFVDVVRKLNGSDSEMFNDPDKTFYAIPEKDQGDGCPHCGGRVYMVKAIRDGVQPEDADDPDDYFYYTECLGCAATGPWQKTFAGALAWFIRRAKPQPK